MVTDLARLDAGDLAAGVAPSKTDAARDEYPEDEKFPMVDVVLMEEMEVCLAVPSGGAAAPKRDKLLKLELTPLTPLIPDIPLML